MNRKHPEPAEESESSGNELSDSEEEKPKLIFDQEGGFRLKNQLDEVESSEDSGDDTDDVFWRQMFGNSYRFFRERNEFVPLKDLLKEPSLTDFMDQICENLKFLRKMSKLMKSDDLYDRIMRSFHQIKEDDSEINSTNAFEEAFHGKRQAIRSLLKENVDLLEREELKLREDETDSEEEKTEEMSEYILVIIK